MYRSYYLFDRGFILQPITQAGTIRRVKQWAESAGTEIGIDEKCQFAEMTATCGQLASKCRSPFRMNGARYKYARRLAAGEPNVVELVEEIFNPGVAFRLTVFVRCRRQGRCGEDFQLQML